MTFTIVINGIQYTVRIHAAMRMQQHFISEAIVIQTVTDGDLIEQAHGNDLYELQYMENDEIIIIRVVVNHREHAIITVIDVTQENQSDE